LTKQINYNKINRGGQNAHHEKTLELVENPDKIERYAVCKCRNCGVDLSNNEADSVIKRQCFDVPPVKIEVIEH